MRHDTNTPRIIQLRTIALVLALVASSLLIAPAATQAQVDTPPLTGATVAGFTSIASNGFGDRNISWPWAMTWWNGYLYVGTNRAWHCAETYSLYLRFPTFFPYPPDDPDVVCPENPNEMPLGAEIWRYSPATRVWKRVYQSPKDVHIPNTVGYTTTRDVGFRGMAIFTEPDGTEALYVGGVSPRFIWPEGPPPRILRSTDGLNFEPVPQDPGTVLYELVDASLRNPLVYKDKIYFISGTVQGSGQLLAAANPAGGNDEFQVVSPPATIVSAAAVFNGYLYIGVQDLVRGFSVLKTDASGDPPYQYTQVLSGGGYQNRRPNHEVLSMEVFNGRLYVGGNGIRGSLLQGLGGPAEMLRINPDDSWDVVMGGERETPFGWKFPISGFMPGFGNFFNGHIWRMAVFDNQLFVGTFDASTIQKDHPDRGPNLRPVMGFDLYRSVNGRDFIPVTRTGFDDRFNFGVRNMEATPYGLFLGTANYYYGLQIWHLRSGSDFDGRRAFLPLMTGSGTNAIVAAGETPPVYTGDPPAEVEALAHNADVMVVWEAVPGADHYEIWRSAPVTTVMEDENGESEVVSAGWVDAQLVAETGALRWVDPGAAGGNYMYYVVSRGPGDQSSGPSNLAVVRPASVRDLLAELDGMDWSNPDDWMDVRQEVVEAAAGGSLDDAAHEVANLREPLAAESESYLPGWQVTDALYLLDHLQRRIHLAQDGLIPFTDT